MLFRLKRSKQNTSSFKDVFQPAVTTTIISLAINATNVNLNLALESQIQHCYIYCQIEVVNAEICL